MKRAKLLLLLVLLTGLTFYITKHAEEFQFILSIHMIYVLPVFIINLIGLTLTGYLFYIVICYVSHPIPLMTAYKYFALGGFINTFVPHGGGVYRLVMFKKEGKINYRHGISSLASYGWLIAIISLASGILIIGIYDPWYRFKKVSVLLFLIVLFIIQLLAIPVLNFLVRKYYPTLWAAVPEEPHKPSDDFRMLLAMGGDIIERVVSVMKNAPVLLKSTVIVLMNVMLSMWGIFLLFKSIDRPIDITLSTILAVALHLSSIIEITPGNLGIREFLLGFLSSGMGHGMAQGITISMLWRVISVSNKGIMSFFLLLVEKSPGATEAPPEKREGIFLIGPAFPFRGGISHYNTLLFNHLRENYDMMFYTFKKQYFQWLFPGKDDKDYSADKIAIKDDSPIDKNHKIQVKRELHPLNFMSWIRAGKEAQQYPLILIPWWVAFWGPYYYLFLNALKNGGKNNNKIIFICHNVEEHEHGLIGWMKRFISRNILKRGNGFLLHSPDQERQLMELLKKKMKPTAVSPLPILQVFNRNRYNTSSAREKLDISPNRRVIIFFGFIRKYKGLEYLLKALPIVKAYDPDILLLIVGEVWGKENNYDRYIRSIKDLGVEENTRFINRYVQNEEVELFFKASDFAALPYIDGSGSGILQVAYGMDCPVVTTDISVFENVVQNGKTGITVSPADEVKLAEAIIEMYTPGRIPEMQAEIQRYKKRFDWVLMEEQILKLYRIL